MHKILVVALREYNAAVRTKAFLVLPLVMIPLLMGGSFLAQRMMKDDTDKRKRTIAVVDRTHGAVLLPALRQAFSEGNASGIVIHEEHPPEEGELDALERSLDSRLRSGDLTGWLVIGPDVTRLEPPSRSEDSQRFQVIYKSSRVADQVVQEMLRAVLNAEVQRLRSERAGLSPEKVRMVARPVSIDRKWDPSMIAPFALMMLMFMLIMMTTTPLMQGVVEEKMQRIAEVLLGSLSPFSLMLGKLLGMTGVSLTIAAVYLGGGYWAARQYGYAEFVPLSLLIWFLVYQTLAVLLFGALFIAIGAACTDMRETQNLLWPVMLMATLPLFFLGPMLRNPNSSIIIGLSYFPFATPSMMMARQGLPQGVAPWEPYLGATLMLVATLVCVWAAGRISGWAS